MDIAEIKACSATSRAGQLIIAYQCFDCGAFHIGHPDPSQWLAHPRKVKIKAPPICLLCGVLVQKRLGRFIRHPEGYALRHKTMPAKLQCYPQRKGKERKMLG
jgi:hypothetical protein